MKWAGISLALLVAGKVAWNAVVNSAQNALFAPEDYTQTVETGGPIEAKYMAMGSCEVEKLEVPAPEEDWGSSWPTTLPTWPRAAGSIRWW